MAKQASERKVRQFKNRPLRPGDPHKVPKGRLLIIGGHEDKVDEQVILRELAELVGSGKLVVTTVASDLPAEQWDEYERTFRGLGVKHLYHLKIKEREDAEAPKSMTILEGACAVFFTGGDQLKITSQIGDTPVYSRIIEMYRNGGTIAGTSAGASVMSETMIVGGNGEGAYKVGADLKLAPGLGLARDMVIDQHFSERGRMSRLFGVVAQNPRIIGIGIDEDTAIEIEPFRKFRVLGKGSVSVVDGGGVTRTNIAEEDEGRTVSIFGLCVHVLSQGDEFDLVTRTPHSRPAAIIDEELGIERSNGKKDEEEEEE
jgi:cyanophycinase